MSAVARVFVILNLLIAAGFLFAAATFLALNNDYRGKYIAEQEGRKRDVTAKDLEIKRLEDDLTTKRNEIQSLRENKGTLEGTVTTQNSQIQSLESEKKTKDTQLAEAQEAVQAAGTNVASMQADNQDLRQKAENAAKEARQKDAENAALVAERDGLQKTVAERQDTIHSLETQVASLTEKVDDLGVMIDYAKRVRGVDFDGLLTIPAMEGNVVRADNQSKLAQVALGTNNGLVLGATLSIHRGGTYIGQLRIDEVSTNFASGTVEILAPGQSVRIGDKVSSTL